MEVSLTRKEQYGKVNFFVNDKQFSIESHYEIINIANNLFFEKGWKLESGQWAYFKKWGKGPIEFRIEALDYNDKIFLSLEKIEKRKHLSITEVKEILFEIRDKIQEKINLAPKIEKISFTI